MAAVIEAIRRWLRQQQLHGFFREENRRVFADHLQRSANAIADSILKFARPRRSARAPRHMQSSALDRPRTYRVRVHVYSLISKGKQRLCRSVVGGLYHCGVEVGGVEYGFGFHEEATTGVWKQLPKQLPKDFAGGKATHLSTIDLGEAVLTPRQLQTLLLDISREYPGNGYHVLTRNCNHFADDLCQRLVQRSPPSWVNAAANRGARLTQALGSASSALGKAARLVPLPPMSRSQAPRSIARASEGPLRGQQQALPPPAPAASAERPATGEGVSAEVALPAPPALPLFTTAPEAAAAAGGMSAVEVKVATQPRAHRLERRSARRRRPGLRTDHVPRDKHAPFPLRGHESREQIDPAGGAYPESAQARASATDSLSGTVSTSSQSSGAIESQGPGLRV